MTGFLREGNRVVGATVRDLETGNELEIRAKSVVNAAGVWTDEIQEHDRRASGSFRVQASKGVHVVIPRDRIDASSG